jgi:methyltransferase (TIGR00027 family)
MLRTKCEAWEMATGSGAKACFQAALRALAGRNDDPLIDDPFAEPLVRALGVDFFTRLASGELDLARVDNNGAWGLARLRDMLAVRTRVYDIYFMGASGAGIRQAVVLAPGLDTRAYRLPWPAGTTVYEIDEPKILQFKTHTMADLEAELGAVATADLRAVGVDLRDDWPAALIEAGFDPTRPAMWSAEGLIAYLAPDAQDGLLASVTRLSAAGSRLATENLPNASRAIPALTARSQEIADRWRQHGLKIDMSHNWHPGDRSDVVDFLRCHGWETAATSAPELFTLYGLPAPTDDGEEAALFASRAYVTATRI